MGYSNITHTHNSHCATMILGLNIIQNNIYNIQIEEVLWYFNLFWWKNRIKLEWNSRQEYVKTFLIAQLTNIFKINEIDLCVLYLYWRRSFHSSLSTIHWLVHKFENWITPIIVTYLWLIPLNVAWSTNSWQNLIKQYYL